MIDKKIQPIVTKRLKRGPDWLNGGSGIVGVLNAEPGVTKVPRFTQLYSVIGERVLQIFLTTVTQKVLSAVALSEWMVDRCIGCYTKAAHFMYYSIVSARG